MWCLVNVHPVGESPPIDGQFCTALNPKFIKPVNVLKIVNTIDVVISVNVNNLIVLFYVHVML